MEAECRAWMDGERFPVDWGQESLLGEAVAARFPEWLEVVRELALAEDNEERVSDIGYVLRPAVDREQSLIAHFGPEFRLDRKLAHLFASVVEYTDVTANATIEWLTEPVVVDTWIRHSTQDDSFDFWAWSLVNDVISEDTERGWLLILRLIAAAPEAVLGSIGAGPLEDFASSHAEEFLERIEEACVNNESLRTAMTSMWIWDDLDEETFERLSRACGSAMDRPTSQAEADERRASWAVFDAANERANEIWRVLETLHPDDPESQQLNEELAVLLEMPDAPDAPDADD